MPLTNKQLELIVASVIGAEVNSAVRLEIEGYQDQNPPYPRNMVYMNHCGIEPECDVLPCLNTISFTGPDVGHAPC
jgi:hypothetical protein